MKIEKYKLKIVFMGTPEFAVPSLKKLIKNGGKILTIVTNKDKPMGRKQKITAPPVKKIALQHKIPVLQPEKLAEIKNKLSKLKPDLIVVAAFAKIIPKEILEIPKYGSINVHASLLPKYRGASPIQQAILNGEKYTGATIMLMDEKIDHGPILSQKKIKIGADETAQTLHNKLSQLGADLLINTLPKYIQNKIKPRPQDEKKAVYAKILTREDGKINWKKNAENIERQIRAFTPWPGTWTILNGKRLKIIKAETKSKKSPTALSAGQGYLLPKIVQPEGKKPMKWEEFLRGHKIKSIRPAA